MVKKIFNVLTVMICLLTITACDHVNSTSDKTDIRAEIVDFGIYELRAKRMIIKQNTDTTAGYTSHAKNVNEIVLVQQTEDVPVVKGTVFGFKVKFLGLPDGEGTPIDLRYQHPPIVGHDGKISTGFTLNKRPKKTNSGFEGGVFYRLSKEYELVPGEWNFAVMHKDRVLAEKTFTLTQQ